MLIRPSSPAAIGALDLTQRVEPAAIGALDLTQRVEPAPPPDGSRIADRFWSAFPILFVGGILATGSLAAAVPSCAGRTVDHRLEQVADLEDKVERLHMRAMIIEAEQARAFEAVADDLLELRRICEGRRR